MGLKKNGDLAFWDVTVLFSLIAVTASGRNFIIAKVTVTVNSSPLWASTLSYSSNDLSQDEKASVAASTLASIPCLNLIQQLAALGESLLGSSNSMPRKSCAKPTSSWSLGSTDCGYFPRFPWCARALILPWFLNPDSERAYIGILGMGGWLILRLHVRATHGKLMGFVIRFSLYLFYLSNATVIFVSVANQFSRMNMPLYSPALLPGSPSIFLPSFRDDLVLGY